MTEYFKQEKILQHVRETEMKDLVVSVFGVLGLIDLVQVLLGAIGLDDFG